MVRQDFPQAIEKSITPTPMQRRGVLSALRSAITAPLSLVHATYHASIPYEKRLIFWSWRGRQTFLLRQFMQNGNFKLVAAGRRELRDILAQYPDSKGVVIFPPSVPWYTELYQRPHQMAQAFASLGYVVLYWVEDMDGDRIKRFSKVAERLHLCNVPPSVLRICDQPIFISYTYNYNWSTLLRKPVLIYELIDHLDIFSNFPAGMLRRYHRRLLRRADVVAGTADDLLAELKSHRSDAILCPNGVDMLHFSSPANGHYDIPEDMRSIVANGQPIVGYYGAMAEWFDFDLVKHAAEALPEYQFVLIGPDYDGRTMRGAEIQTYSNIHWLGPKKYSELPLYLACFDVATIPFKISDALHAVSPIKLFEYMAGARPVVTTDLAECRKYPVVFIAHNQDEWVELLRQAVTLRHDAEYLAKLRQTAETNTWRSRAETLVCAMEEHKVVKTR